MPHPSHDEDKTDVNALFLGPKSENRKFFKEMLDLVMDEHIYWRRDFHPSDRPIVGVRQQHTEAFEETLMRTEEALLELSSRLKGGSIPAFSPRYLGHMLSDTLMSANLGYLATILYNPNNCSYDASPASSELELEVGQQFARLFGYDPAQAWSHITAGGTIANYEALWAARNLKSLGQALCQTHPELLDSYTPIQRANLPVETLLGLLSEVKERGELARVREHTAQFRGAGPHLGRVLVPQSKHYSWVKAVDILGLGQESLVPIRVGSDFRMDISHLSEVVRDLTERGEPILAVVAVAGTTEVGAVDEIHRMVELREELTAQRGVGFLIHVDAAYGGYARALFLDCDGEFQEQTSLGSNLVDSGALSPGVAWPTGEVYQAYKAMEQTDSITVDPHKLGYVPYSAGGIVMKDKRILDLISYYASYVFERGEVEPSRLGSFIMEGSKPGASAAAVWMAHKVVPLNSGGYGKVLGNSIEGAQKLYQAFLNHGRLVTVSGRSFQIVPLARPDLNVVTFALNELGNSSLERANELNRFIYDECSYRSGPVYLEDFILSKTVLRKVDYDCAVLPFLERLGLENQGWEEVFVLRSCMMTPFLMSNQTFGTYRERFWSTLTTHLDRYSGQ